MLVSQSWTRNSGGPLDSQTWQTEWKTAPLDKVQLCEYENQTLEAFVAAWLASVPPEFFTFSYCAWLWNKDPLLRFVEIVSCGCGLTVHAGIASRRKDASA